jgi:hypothetical protein
MLEEGGRAFSFTFSFLLMLGWSGVFGRRFHIYPEEFFFFG